ncbi:PREDICTED: transport and Golgi organization protein 1 [Eufriesea mexicana]|uniref:transport and Golgi organization protein 1 n=1 Tax=Eufriesea mexicana TaxID=516756 RepID=UPI00083BC3B7|nr:PREDICTED: transport and Golgi organization protein 1 [Eufriesea mexicana]
MLVVMWNCNSRNMTEKNLFINVLFLVIAIIFSLISQCSSVLSDKRLCYDPDCSVPVSLARTTLTYTPNEAGLLSVNIGDEVTVYSKEAGKRNDLWGVEIKGKHGFISKTFLKEYKILQKDLKYEVPIDPLSGNNVQSNKKFQSKKNKNKSVFDNKDIKTTKIQDNHNKPFMKPYFMKEIKEAMVVPNKKAAVDEATVDKATHDKLQNKEQAVLTKVDHDFLTNSEEKLNLSNTSGIHSSSLNISTISNKEDYTKENVKNNFITNVKDNKSLKVIDTINFQTPTDSKKTLNIETKEIVDLSEEHNVNSHETIIDSDIKSDMQNALSSDKIDTNNKKATESVTINATDKRSDIPSTESTTSSEDIKIVASNDAGDVQNVKNFDETETKNIQTSEDVTVGESNDTRLDKQNIESSDKSEKKEIRSSQSVTLITTNDTKSDVESVASSDKIEVNNDKPSESITLDATDKKSDVQNTGSTNPIKALHTESSEDIKIVASNDAGDVKNVKNFDETETKNIQTSEDVTVGESNDTKLDKKNIESSDKSEKKEIRSSQSVTTNDTKSDVESAASSDKIEVNNDKPSESITLDATDKKSDVQNTGSTNPTKALHTESSEDIKIVASNDAGDVQNVKNFDETETKNIQTSEDVTVEESNDTKLDKKNIESSDKSKKKEIQSSQSVTLITTNDTKSDVESAASSDKIEINNDKPSESVTIDATNKKSNVQNTRSTTPIKALHTESSEDIKIVASSDAGDVQNVKNLDETETKNIESSDKSEKKAIQSLQSVTLITTDDTKSDVESAASSDKIEANNDKPSESITIHATDKKLDVQNAGSTTPIKALHTESSEVIKISVLNDTRDMQTAENFDKTETKHIQISEGVTTENETNDTTLDKQNIESFDKSETKAIQSSQSVTLIMTNDTKSDVESAVISDKIEVNNKPSESVTIDVTDIKSEEQNAESSNNFETKDIPLLESIVVHKNDIQHLENVTELEIVEYKLKEDEENENTEDSNKLGNDKYNSPLSFESIFQNEVSMTSPTENIETKNIQFFKNIAGQYGATESDPKSSSDIEDTMNQSNLDVHFDSNSGDISSETGAISENNFHKISASFSNVCRADNIECSSEDIQNDFPHHEQNFQDDEVQTESNYWLTLMYLSVTATATLIFSLGYYCIENMRSDRQLIARINKLEKDLLISEAECSMVNENLKSTKRKLSCMEDESFGSDEMVLSLRADLEASQNAKAELEDQVAMLEKDLESATEAGLELEKMLREFLSSNNEVNPLAQSVEDLQTRLNVQQAANESLTNALNLKTQENESLSVELASIKKKYEELEVELIRVTENLKLEINSKNSVEQMLTDKVQQLEMQIKEISTEKATLQKELKGKEVEVKDLVDIINRTNSNNLDLDKLYDVSHIKAEATTLLEERNELKIRLAEVEGAHDLLEEHVKVVKEEIATLSEQCKIAEKEKKDAETRLEVLTNFFEEKEAQRQKEEAIWLQQQGEVVSTVERIQAMQNEIQNYKQQTEVLKREILDQEREYKNQISLFETKAHEQWVIARQVERRLEESKVEAGQLRNRLTLIEKNINDVDPEAKLHRLEANGETTTSPPLFIGAESSSSPIMFSGSSSVPPPPPYLHSLFTPYLPLPLPNTSGVPPYEVSQRPPPLGGRLSSPPPMPLHPPASRGYENAGSPPPMSPHLLPPFNHRSPPPPFGSDIHPPPPPPPGSILPPPLGTQHSWGEESLPPPRNSGFHPTQRERVRNHKGSLHSSGESLDKSHHNSKV